jgi:hypothetical protein
VENTPAYSSKNYKEKSFGIFCLGLAFLFLVGGVRERERERERESK